MTETFEYLLINNQAQTTHQNLLSLLKQHSYLWLYNRPNSLTRAKIYTTQQQSGVHYHVVALLKQLKPANVRFKKKNHVYYEQFSNNYSSLIPADTHLMTLRYPEYHLTWVQLMALYTVKLSRLGPHTKIVPMDLSILYLLNCVTIQLEYESTCLPDSSTVPCPLGAAKASWSKVIT